MITITAHGRLAEQPNLVPLGNGNVTCEFRLLSTRFANNKEHVEAVTFVCYGEEAELIASSTVKGQEMEVTGYQVTQRSVRDNVTKYFVKYQVTWFTRGRKPFTGERSAGYQTGQGAQANGAQRGGNNPSDSQPRPAPYRGDADTYSQSSQARMAGEDRDEERFEGNGSNGPGHSPMI